MASISVCWPLMKFAALLLVWLPQRLEPPLWPPRCRHKRHSGEFTECLAGETYGHSRRREGHCSLASMRFPSGALQPPGVVPAVARASAVAMYESSLGSEGHKAHKAKRVLEAKCPMGPRVASPLAASQMASRPVAL